MNSKELRKQRARTTCAKGAALCKDIHFKQRGTKTGVLGTFGSRKKSVQSIRNEDVEYLLVVIFL